MRLWEIDHSDGRQRRNPTEGGHVCMIDEHDEKLVEIRKYWPVSLAFPPELPFLCTYWLNNSNERISGAFRLGALANEFSYLSNAARLRLGQFGRGSTGSLYCVWCQDDGPTPIVHLGSEGDDMIVLASNFSEFLTILSVGYWELGHHVRTADLPDGSPDLCGGEPNANFQSWVREVFHLPIPATAKQVQSEAASTHDNFAVWVNQNTKT